MAARVSRVFGSDRSAFIFIDPRFPFSFNFTWDRENVGDYGEPPAADRGHGVLRASLHDYWRDRL
jgi:hypothetical protein